MANAIEPVTQIKNTLMSKAMKAEIKMVLPPHIDVDKFVRTTMTAVARDEKLIGADRRSLFLAAQACAQDGLMPDGHEAALVTFAGKVQYMPMVAGILKKIRNSGELAHIDASVVFESDDWDYWVDEKGKHFHFKPDETIDRLAVGDPPSNVKLVVAYATTKDGSVHVCPMTVAQVEKARKVSRSAQGAAWKNWWDGMAEKTALKKLSKRLPMSSDLEEFLRRDDEVDTDFDLMDDPPQEQAPVQRTSRMAAAVAATTSEPIDAEAVAVEPDPEPDPAPEAEQPEPPAEEAPVAVNDQSPAAAEREPGDDDPDAAIPI